jgi:uncharacterized membrane-anchored protein YitT (DUF2179 family)
MPPGGYRRVQAAEATAASGEQQQHTRSDRISDKLYAVGWMAVALLVARWTDFFHVLLSSDRINRPILYIAIAGLGINTVLSLYLIVYLPKIVKLTDSSAWDVYCPRVVPTMCVVGVCCAIFLIRATWPVWGFLAPLLLGLQAMGALCALHFIPWF